MNYESQKQVRNSTTSYEYQVPPIKKKKTRDISESITHLDQISFEKHDDQMNTRKKINRQLIQEEIRANNETNILQNRIKLLAAED